MRQTSGTSQKILETALGVLIDWEDSKLTLDSGLDAVRHSSGSAPSGAVSSLLFEYFRHKGFIDNLISVHAKKGLVRQEMRLLIACAATQMFFQTGIAPQSAVNVAVDTAKFRHGAGGGAFVNAMLREFMRDNSFDHENIPKSFPLALEERWRNAFGKKSADAMIALFATNPAISFRVREKSLSEEDIASVGAKKIEGLDFTGAFDFYETADAGTLFSKDWLEKGLVYVQDPATAMPLSLIDFKMEGRILDCCAAPGGKAVMTWELCEKNRTLFTVADRSPQRIKQMNVNLRRAGVRSRSVQCDATEQPFGKDAFDFVMADVPCSNTGVLRRRPDAPWRFSERRLADAVVLQRRILDSISETVAPGGRILYSTCSVEADEDSALVARFVDEHVSTFELVRERLLLPAEKHDGSYAALLRRIK